MLNGEMKEQALSRLKSAIEKHKEAQNRVEKQCVSLFEMRMQGSRLVKQIENYVNKMKNTPIEFKRAISEYNVNYGEFKNVIDHFQTADMDSTVQTVGGVGTGALAGTAVAAFAPTAAMAIATTFGTASTGAAISGLTGVAATNAALAWLGGGALAVGGGGVAAGEALLALAGPVGWTIGAAALLGGIFYKRNANEKMAQEAEAKRLDVEAEIRALNKHEYAANRLTDTTAMAVSSLRKVFYFLSDEQKVNDWRNQPKHINDCLMALINLVRGLGELLAITPTELEDNVCVISA